MYFFGPEGRLSGEEEMVKDSNNVLSQSCAGNGPWPALGGREPWFYWGYDSQIYVPLFLKQSCMYKVLCMPNP